MAVLVGAAVVVRAQAGLGLVRLVAVTAVTHHLPPLQPLAAEQTRVAEVVEAAVLQAYLCQGGQADPATAW